MWVQWDLVGFTIVNNEFIELKGLQSTHYAHSCEC